MIIDQARARQSTWQQAGYPPPKQIPIPSAWSTYKASWMETSSRATTEKYDIRHLNKNIKYLYHMKSMFVKEEILGFFWMFHCRRPSALYDWKLTRFFSHGCIYYKHACGTFLVSSFLWHWLGENVCVLKCSIHIYRVTLLTDHPCSVPKW